MSKNNHARDQLEKTKEANLRLEDEIKTMQDKMEEIKRKLLRYEYQAEYDVKTKGLMTNKILDRIETVLEEEIVKETTTNDAGKKDETVVLKSKVQTVMGLVDVDRDVKNKKLNKGVKKYKDQVLKFELNELEQEGNYLK